MEHTASQWCPRLLKRSQVNYMLIIRCSQLLNEIMPLIYKRFTDKSAEEWRQIYKVRSVATRFHDVPYTDIVFFLRNIESSTSRIPR